MSYYNSTTHGRIPLSKTGKSLLQDLRYAIVHAIGTGDYNADRQAIAHARGELAVYISRLENPIHYFGEKTMCDNHSSASPDDNHTSAPAPKPEDARSRASAIHTDIKAINGRSAAVAYSHGYDRIRGILRKFGAERVSDLRLRQLWDYCYALEQLAEEVMPADRTFADAKEKANRLWGDYYAAGGRDRFMFEAGQEYQRNK